jgi:hypothetical protein
MNEIPKQLRKEFADEIYKILLEGKKEFMIAMSVSNKNKTDFKMLSNLSEEESLGRLEKLKLNILFQDSVGKQENKTLSSVS